MIFLDTPRKASFRGRTRTTAHLASDQHGRAGTKELLLFGKAIGMRPSWIQHQGEPREHFDLFDGRVAAALDAGAIEVSPKMFIKRIVWPKREDRVDPLHQFTLEYSDDDACYVARHLTVDGVAAHGDTATEAFAELEIALELAISSR